MPKVERDFVRQWPAAFKNKAILFDYDDTLRRSTGKKAWPECPTEVEILPGRKEKLKQLASERYILFGVSNQSAVAKGLSIDVARKCFEQTNKLLGFDIDVKFCPHKVPPVTCYCRKPHPGLGAAFIMDYMLNPSKCAMVGDQTSDKTFASRCGFEFQHVAEFFGS